MAKVIATIGGVALKPGVSKNRRLYSPQIVARAVEKAQDRIRAGDEPMVMLTHHAAGDASREITARLTGMSLDEDGNARYTAAIADTAAGRDIAALIDRSDGQAPHLKGVSIRGYWTGTVRKVRGPDGKPVETADGMDLDGLDFTRTPGVTGAEVDTFAWADREGRETRSSTTERVAIYESVQEARVTITEETAPAAEAGTAAVAEAIAASTQLAALRDTFGLVEHVLQDGFCVTCAQAVEAAQPMGQRSAGLSGPGGPYADPGYQADKKPRYQLDTKAHAKAAYSYFSVPKNAAKYTSAQVKRIKNRIMAALKKFGVTVSASESWVVDSFRLGPEVTTEHYGGSDGASFSVSLNNGMISVCISSYCVPPEDLDIIATAAMTGACHALADMDPDMDGDVDVPGVGDGSDPDNDAPGESAPDNTDPAAGPAAATTETEGPVMTETTTPAAGSTPATDQNAALAEAVTAALAAQEDARKARKAAKREAREKAETEAARTAQESAAAQAAANAALGQGIPATAGASATETQEQRVARLSALADQKFAEAAAREGLAAAETDEQILERMIEEKMVPLRQARAEGGDVQRKGLAKLEAIADSPQVGKQLQEATNEDLKLLAAASFGPRGTRS